MEKYLGLINCSVPHAKRTEVTINEKAPPAACAILLVRLHMEMDSPAGESISLFKVLLSGENRRANAYFAKVRDYYTKLEARYPDGFSADRSLHRAENDI